MWLINMCKNSRHGSHICDWLISLIIMWIVNMHKNSRHTSTRIQSARKASWNPEGVEPVHSNPAEINPGSLKWMEIRKYFSSELMRQIKQKNVYGVENPLSRSFLGRYARIYVTWLIDMCARIHDTHRSRHEWVAWHIWTSYVTHMCDVLSAASMHRRTHVWHSYVGHSYEFTTRISHVTNKSRCTNE